MFELKCYYTYGYTIFMTQCYPLITETSYGKIFSKCRNGTQGKQEYPPFEIMFTMKLISYLLWASLKGKNLLPEGVNSFLKEKPIFWKGFVIMGSK